MQLRVWAGANTPNPEGGQHAEHGLLMVTMPKTPVAKGFTIPVKAE
jgi:hypothetical protein